MSIRQTITCDVCGKVETFPVPRGFDQEDNWQEFLRGDRWQHVCSVACAVDFIRVGRAKAEPAR